MTPTPKMIVILLGWLALANPLLSLPFGGLQIYHLQIVHDPGRQCCAEKNDIFIWFYLQIKFFQPFKHQFDTVQHVVYADGKYTDVI